MTVVDYIDLEDDECYVKVGFVDLTTDEDSVEKDVNVEEDDNVARSRNVAKAAVFSSVSEQDASPSTPLSTLQREQADTASLSMVEHGATTSSVVAEETMQPEHQEFLATIDVPKEATQSGNHELIAVAEPGSSTVPCTRSEVSIRVRGVTGNSMGITGIGCLHAQEDPEGDIETDENCDFEAEPEALCQNVLAISLPPQYKEKEISQCRKLYGREGKKQVNTCARQCNRQLSVVHSKGVQPTLHNGDRVSGVVGSVRNCTSSTVLDGEVVASTYQGCSKTSQGNAMDIKVHDSGSTGCMIEGCTNGAQGDTSLCSFHNSRPRKRCCTVIGCTKGACCSSQGRTDRCVKHGGGKRCKYDGCGKGAQGKTDHCVAHGGGRRCKFQECKKSAQGRTNCCMEHGGGRHCKFQGCSAITTWRKGLCSMHRTSILSGNNSAHEMLSAPAPARWAKKAERSKGRNSCSVIGGRAQKRQNTSDYVNTRSFNVLEFQMAEEKGRVLICQSNMLKAQQTTPRMNSESGLAAGSLPLLRY